MLKTGERRLYVSSAANDDSKSDIYKIKEEIVCVVRYFPYIG